MIIQDGNLNDEHAELTNLLWNIGDTDELHSFVYSVWLSKLLKNLRSPMEHVFMTLELEEVRRSLKKEEMLPVNKSESWFHRHRRSSCR